MKGKWGHLPTAIVSLFAMRLSASFEFLLADKPARSRAIPVIVYLPATPKFKIKTIHKTLLIWRNLSCSAIHSILKLIALLRFFGKIIFWTAGDAESLREKRPTLCQCEPLLVSSLPVRARTQTGLPNFYFPVSSFKSRHGGTTYFARSG